MRLVMRVLLQVVATHLPVAVTALSSRVVMEGLMEEEARRRRRWMARAYHPLRLPLLLAMSCRMER